MQQTRPRGFTDRIPPLPFRHLSSTSHLRTRHHSAPPKLTQSSGQAPSPSHCGIRNAGALCERRRVGSSRFGRGRGFLFLLSNCSGRGVWRNGVRLRLRLRDDPGCRWTRSTCFAIRTRYQELVWSRACAARGPRYARRALRGRACGRSGRPRCRRGWRCPRSWCWRWWRHTDGCR
jgi:hypothetical protein